MAMRKILHDQEKYMIRREPENCVKERRHVKTTIKSVDIYLLLQIKNGFIYIEQLLYIMFFGLFKVITCV